MALQLAAQTSHQVHMAAAPVHMGSRHTQTSSVMARLQQPPGSP